MTSITREPISMPATVPIGPATGRNVVPGMTNAPHPTAQPNDSAHAITGERYRESPVSLALISFGLSMKDSSPCTTGNRERCPPVSFFQEQDAGAHGLMLFIMI